MSGAAERERVKRWQEQDCDLYAALGLHPSVSAAEIRKGFRRVALSCHPDKVKPEERAAATRRFQLIAEAYSVLSDDDMRKKYDGVRAKIVGTRGTTKGTTAAAPPAAKDAKPAAARNAPAARRPDARQPPASGASGGVMQRCGGCGRDCPENSLRRCPECDADMICPSCEACEDCQEEEQPPPTRSAEPEKEVVRHMHRELCPGCEDRFPLSELTKRCPGCRKRLCNTCESCWNCAPGYGDEPRSLPVDQAIGMKDILLAMGFSRKQVKAAMQHCSSVEESVAYMMVGGGTAEAMDAFGRGMSEVLENAGELGGHVLEGAGQLGGLVQSWVGGYGGSPAEAEAGGNGDSDLVPQLVNMGFSVQQARAACRRCSSMEAAVQYLADNPTAGA